MQYPFTQWVLKLVYDDNARNAYLAGGPVPTPYGPITAAQTAILRPPPPNQLDASTKAINEEISDEHESTAASVGLAQAVPHVIKQSLPNWPSRP